MNPSSSNPVGRRRTARAHDDTHCQNGSSAWLLVGTRFWRLVTICPGRFIRGLGVGCPVVDDEESVDRVQVTHCPAPRTTCPVRCSRWAWPSRCPVVGMASGAELVTCARRTPSNALIALDLVAHHAGEVVRIELVDTFVVGDRDGRRRRPVAGHGSVGAELRPPVRSENRRPTA